MASSSSYSSSAPAFCSQVWKYHVFLSFRGEDTRKTFVDHLYTALIQKGIHTYKDDETLPRGESIGSSLMEAIEESQIAIIIFSKNYADSSWCLDELLHIMKCKDTRGQIVMPVFYDVDPSEVRKKKRKYGETFLKHELESKQKVLSWGQAFLDDLCGWFLAPRVQLQKIRESQAKHEVEKNKIESWRKALVDASNISGWEPTHIANGHESKCIEQIVDTISRRLHPLNSSVDDNLVGVEARMHDLITKLQLEFGGKRMIGIWGVGGGGKTTLASSTYDEICSKFEGYCFINNVREESSDKNGLVSLQKKIICAVLKQNQVHVGRVEEGRRMIKDRLQHRKVLIVLDDVDNLEHLEELAGSRNWFGEGSRILITTRDEHVLTGHKVDVIHNISLLNSDEATKLFCKHAPRGDKHIEDYEVLSKEVVSYAGGLPLALRVLGRFLCDKDMNEWRCALARLKEIPDNKILDKLKISFDGLRPVERELFLNIACFFRRSWQYSKADIMKMLDACGFHPGIGIKVLVQKALITVSEDGRFDMHDLVQEMAHYIVRGEHPQNPEKHSRIWKKEDVLKICAMGSPKNLDRIEAIDARCFEDDESQRVLQVAVNMKKLRWISLESRWDETTFPENFPPGELRCLTLFYLGAKQLWEGNKFLPNLIMIKLVGLTKLMKTPEFDGLPNLERFMVDGCPLLEEIHPSFGCLEKLVCVEITGCDNLKMLPPITQSKKLETLRLSSCTKLFNSLKIQQNVENIVPHNMNNIRQWFFSGYLRKLNLSFCNLADGDITSSAVWELPNLQELNLTTNKFSRLNFSLLRLPRLKLLDVSICTGLVELSELPSSISVVIADSCSSLESFGDISNCKWLWKVSAQGYNKLGPHGGDILLNSMIQGNAKDYFISITLSDIDIWKGLSVPWVKWVKTYNMPLQHDWYNAFSGILMFVKCAVWRPDFNIVIKQGVDEDFRSELHQEPLDTHYCDTSVGCVSFSSLRHTGCLNSTYNIISFSIGDGKVYGDEHRFRAVLVPKDDPMQTKKVSTDSSEFWDEKEVYGRKTFTIQRESNSSIKIHWDAFSHIVFNRDMNVILQKTDEGGSGNTM